MSGAALYAGVAAAGAVGAPARFLLDRVVQRRVGRRRAASWPWGVLVVNTTGSGLLGLVVGLGLYGGFDGVARSWLAAGFCGSFTTFSTFAVDADALLANRRRQAAMAYVGATAVMTLAAAALGLAAAAALGSA